jgi:hypothetical protein
MISVSDCRWSAPIPIEKNIQDQAPLWEYFHIFQQDIPDLFSMFFCYTCTASYHHILDQPLYNVKLIENIKEDVKGMYILLSDILTVVTSAVRGTTIYSPSPSPPSDNDDDSVVVHVRCSLYPKTHPLV